MRVHCNHLLCLGLAGKLTEKLHGKSSGQRAVGRDWEAKMVAGPSQQSAPGSVVSWCVGHELGRWLMFAVENRMCAGGGG